ncbi:MAG: TolC family protein [Bacteroidales bacterium]|nr:TolC family protein [Bacteroidales bacterium]
MKKSLLILSFVIIAGFSSLYPQKILTLRECYEGASAASAISGEKDSYFAIWQLKDRNHAKGWLPSLDAGGSFIYNSEVIDIGNALGSLPIPGIADAIKPLPHEQYKLTVDINQMIYDGGAINGARAIEKADLKVNQKQTEADLYKLRSQINTYYFNLMLLDRQKELLDNYLELIEKRISSMESAVRNGVILKSDIDVMLSEKIRLEQQLKENEIHRNSFIKILSDLTNIQIDQSCKLTPPVFSKALSPDLSRPELDIFDLRKEQLDATMQVINSKRRPKAFGFATLGYGNPPGNNFFRDEFDTYYIVGAGIKWNIFDWNKARNEKQVISLQKGMIDNRKNDLADNLSHLLEAKNAEISSLDLLIRTDKELIELRKRITSSAESQYENGTITAAELLNEINSERQAFINHELHKISLAMAKVEYLNISGKEIE